MRQEDESNMDKPFGGKVVVLGGDFRQILPVIPKGGRQDIVSATVNSSDLWKYCKVLKLTKNMRLRTTGIPNHKIILKEGAPIMLLRNIDQAASLCIGTRLIVADLGTKVIKATVITGTNIGEDIFIPRMDMVPSVSGYPFKFERRQFPISLS
ncbi:uncharacterized protein LOC130713022 [Lotus japonicus]|uniref:uncharacterized protein LOC130713022 n=1 Tax=Lotus japonicus TaxID=34305 RepID=UPI002586E93B|nr:uncharacterized protein LOC130713022 [Lotus japonicus]